MLNLDLLHILNHHMTIQFVLEVTAAPFIYLPLVVENLLHHVVIFPLISLGKMLCRHIFKWRPFLSCSADERRLIEKQRFYSY